MKNQRGQMVVEMILVMIVLLAIVGSLQTMFRETEAVKTLVSGPWRVLSGMIQSGAWRSQQEALVYHPNLNNRHLSLKGKTQND